MNSDRLTIIEETQQEILTEIKNLKLEIEKLQTICSRMDTHISYWFVRTFLWASVS